MTSSTLPTKKDEPAAKNKIAYRLFCMLASGLHALLLPYCIFAHLRQLKRLKQPEKRVFEKLGYALPDFKVKRPLIWIHAVSVGEYRSAEIFIKHLIKKEKYNIFVTTTSVTSSILCAKTLQPYQDSVRHHFFPYDIGWIIKPMLRTLKPQQVMLMETEIWPNLLYHLNQQQVPVSLISARLNERSFQRYHTLGWLTQQMLHCFNQILVQESIHYDRFLALGAAKAQLHVTGNLKWSAPTPASNPKLEKKIATWRNKAPTWLALSTHEGEEAMILAAHRLLRKAQPEARLMLAPRHPERWQAVYELALLKQHTVLKQSLMDDASQSSTVLLADSLGEIGALLRSADTVFMGGSLTPVGGHNPIEPAQFGLPILSGPHVFNFETIYHKMDQAHAVTWVNNTEELAQALIQFYDNPNAQKEANQHIVACLKANQDALRKTLEQLGH